MQKLTEKIKNIDKSTLKRYALLLAIELFVVGILVAIDLVSKHYVFKALDAEDKTLTIIDGFLYFETHRNTGAAFSIFSGNALALGIVSLVVSIVVLVVEICTINLRNPFLRIGIVLILGGAIGNLVDRFAFGYVRDFVDLDSIFDWVGVFNFADSCLTIGVVVLLIYVIFFFSKDSAAIEAKKKNPAEKTSETPLKEEAIDDANN